MDDDYIEVTNHDIKTLQHHYWMQGDLEWKLDALQRRISASVKSRPKAKKICVLSSRQVGKSYWSVTYSLEHLQNNKCLISRIVAPTLSNCHDIVNDNLMRITQDAPDGLITKRRSEMRWELSNGSSLRLGALERAHVDDMNRGGNATLIIYEECGFVKGDDFLYGVNSVLGPQLLRSQGGREIFVSTPPLDPDHPLVTVIKPECEELGTFFAFTVFDSPTISPDQIIEAAVRSGCEMTREFMIMIKERRITSENVLEMADRTNTVLSDAFKREFLAMIIRPSTLMVVPDFRDNLRHVLAFDNPRFSSWTVTVDWGGVRDLTVALLHTYDYLANKDLIKAEKVFPPNTPTSTIVDSLRSWDKDYRIDNRWADVHGQTQVDLNQLGYIVNLPQKSDWLGTVQAMAVKFTLDQIYIEPSCTFTRQSLKAGMFNKQKTDFERSEKLGHCDAIAALMYAIRCQDRSNPYVNKHVYSSEVMTIHKEDQGEVALAEALNPKTWDAKRTFGGFRK